MKQRKVIWFFYIFLSFVSFFILPSFIFAAEKKAVNPLSVQDQIQAIIKSGMIPNLKQKRIARFKKDFEALYAPAAYQTVWLDQGKPKAAIQEMMSVFQSARERGLNPEDYDVALFKKILDRVGSDKPLSNREMALLDTGLTASCFRFLSDSYLGKMDPKELGLGLSVSKEPLNLSSLAIQLLQGKSFKKLADAVEPQLAQYRRIKEALSFYRGIAAQGKWHTLTPQKLIEPKDIYGQSDLLADNLKLVGDLNADLQVLPNAIYDGELVEAVKRFQERHGLEVDGVLGRATFAAIKVPLTYRVRQLELSLERLRWLPAIQNSPFIVVNIPVYKLWAFSWESGISKLEFEMKVVVGDAVKHQTPIFYGTMKSVEFQPYWNVTAKIAREEIIPDWIKDPKYLEKHDMEIVNYQGERPDLSLSELRYGISKGTLILRQRPGVKNPLGRIKFIFPNSESVYLHDTPEGALFEQYRRDFSHGCVRVERPADLARFVLRGNPEWTEEKITEALKNPKRQWVNLKFPVQVLLFYSTASTDADGRVYFSDDIYGHDLKLDEALRLGASSLRPPLGSALSLKNKKLLSLKPQA